MIDDHRTLPGLPRKSLVLKVRKALNHYGIRPYSPSNHLNQIWRDAWEWAHDCRSRLNVKSRRGKLYFGPDKWPTPNEIASQYVFLLLARMKDAYALGLPYAATTQGRIPAAIAQEYKIPTRPDQLLLELG